MSAREDLLGEQERLRRFVDQLRGDYRGFVDASRDTNADDEHDPEGATIAFERAQVGAVIDQAERRLEGIAAALSRIEEGSWGGCETCGQPIPAERLAVRPDARACVGCA